MSATPTHSVMPRRRDTPRRITPGLIEFYRMRANKLRAECYRDMWRAIWTRLTRIGRRRSSTKLLQSLPSQTSSPEHFVDHALQSPYPARAESESRAQEMLQDPSLAS
jgi:hypothetical protein